MNGNAFLFFRPIIQYTLVEMMLWHGIQKHWGGQKLAPNKQANCRRQKWLKLTAVISFQLTEKVPRYPHQMFGNDYADCNVNLAQKPYFQRPLLNLRSHFVKLKIYCWTILFISQLLKITHVLIRYSKWDFNLQKILLFFF